jgi:hypothetical protein
LIELVSAVQIVVAILALSRVMITATKWRFLGIEYIPLTMFVWMTFNGLAPIGLLGAVLITLPVSIKICDRFTGLIHGRLTKKPQ